MSLFLTTLITESIDDNAAGGRGFWRVTTPFRYRSDILGLIITIEPGFITDWASVPRIPIAYWLLGDRNHKASIIHDWLYHHHEICDEQTANKVFLEACKLAGGGSFSSLAVYLGVKFFGGSSWEKDGRGDGHTIVDGEII